MLRSFLILAVVLVAASLRVEPVRAQSLCFPAPLLADSLTKRHGERIVARSAISRGAVLEHWEDTRPGGDRSWTMVVLTPDGRRCPLASGHDWQRLESAEETSGQAV